MLYCIIIYIGTHRSVVKGRGVEVTPLFFITVIFILSCKFLSILIDFQHFLVLFIRFMVAIAVLFLYTFEMCVCMCVCAYIRVCIYRYIFTCCTTKQKQKKETNSHL